MMSKEIEGIKCSTCGKGEINFEVKKEYPTKIGGIAFIVKNARIGTCSNCEEEIVDAKEVEKWENERNRQLIEKDLLFSSEKVIILRYLLDLTIKEFALLLGVTDIAVEGWQQNGLPLGPTSLLLSMLYEEAEKTDKVLHPILDFLEEQQKEREKLIGR